MGNLIAFATVGNLLGNGSQIKVWPFSHLTAISSMEKDSKLGASYKVKPYHSSLNEYFGAIAKMIPITLIAFTLNYLYPIE